MLIKICGISSVDVAQAAEEAGANLIGFVFAESSRQILPEKAAEIAEHLSPRVKKVGVFVNETKEKSEVIAVTVGLDFIQLHGDDTADCAGSLSSPVIEAFTIGDVTDEALATYPCDYYLIDSPGTVYRGGSGKVFDWEQLLRQKIAKRKLILAGGLNEANVAEAIRIVGPVGVDV